MYAYANVKTHLDSKNAEISAYEFPSWQMGFNLWNIILKQDNNGKQS